MAGKIKQTVETEFKTSGAKKTVQQTEQVNKGVTRLGQTTASAGRQFSAQSAGLGGLVGAYAGAAANIFALQQAFAALNRAVQSQQILDGLNSLAAGFGLAGGEILSNLQAITKGQLNFAEASQTANLAISAGIGQKQLEGLTEVALKASRALGRTLSDSMNRVVRGTAKLEPELLDELGIFTRIEPAAQAYALATGKVASSLTNFEKRQAFANAVLEEGQRKFSSVNTTSATSAESLEKLGSTLVNIGLEIGGIIGDVLAPFAAFISNNVSAAIIAIGLLMRQIFGKGASLAGTAFTAFTDKVITNLNDLSIKASTTKKAYTDAFRKIEQASQKVKPADLFGGKGAIAGKDIVKRLRAGETFSPAEAKIAEKEIQKLMDLNEKSSTKNKAQQEANKQGLQSIQRELVGVGTKAGFTGKIYTKVLTGMTVATNLLKTAVSKLMKAFNVIFIAIAILETTAMLLSTLFDIDFSPLETIGKWVKSFQQESKGIKDSVAGMVSAFMGPGLTNAELSMENMSTAAAELGQTVANATVPSLWGLQDVSKSLNMWYGTGWLVDYPAALSQYAVNLTAAVASFDGMFPEIDKAIKEFTKWDEASMAVRRTQGAVNALNDRMEELRKTVAKGGKEGQIAIVKLEGIKKVIPFVKEFGARSVAAIGSISSLSGIASAEFYKLAQQGILLGAANKTLDLSYNGLTLGIATVGGELDSVTKLVDTAIISTIALGETFKTSLAAGTANAESAGKTVLAMERNIARAKREIEDIFKFGEGDIRGRIIDRIDKERLIIKELEKQVELINKQKEALVAIEKIQKGIKSMMGGDIKKFDESVFTGKIGSAGIANSKKEQLQNQLAFQKGILAVQEKQLKALYLQRDAETMLVATTKQDLITATAAIEVARRAGKTEDEIVEELTKQVLAKQAYNAATLTAAVTSSTIKKTEQAIVDITKGRLGSIFKVNDALHKQLKTITQQTKTYYKQLAVLEKQHKVNDLIRKIEAQKAKDALTNAKADSRIKIAEANLAIEKDYINVLKEQEKFQDSLLTKKKQDLAAQQKLLKIQGQINLLNIDKKFDPKIAAAGENLADQSAFGNLYTRQEKSDAQRELINLEFEKGMALLTEKKRIAQEEYDHQLSILNLEKQRAKERVTEITARNKAEQAIMDTELQLFAAKKIQEQAVIKQQIKNTADETSKALRMFNLTNEQISLQDKVRKDRIKQTQLQIDLIKLESDANWAFLTARTKAINTELEMVNELNKRAGLGSVDIKKLEITADPVKVDNVNTALNQQRTASTLLADEARKEAGAVYLAQLELTRLSKEKLEHELTTKQKLAALEGELLVQQQIAKSAANEQQIADAQRLVIKTKNDIDALNKNKEATDKKFKAEEEGIKRTRDSRLAALQREENVVKKFMNDVSGVVGGKLKEGVRSFFTAVAEGNLTMESFKEGAKDMFVGMLQGIQEKMTERFIDPVIDDLTASIFGGETKGADNATVTGGNLHVVEKGGNGAVNSAVGELEEAGKTSVQTAKSTAFSFSDMFNKMKASTNPLISLFGSLGSVVTSAISGLGNFASKLLQGITGVGGGDAASSFGSAIVKGAGSLFGQAGVDAFTVGSSLGSPFFTPSTGIAPNVFASGGRVRHMAAGGMQRDRVPAMLEPGEFVMKRSSVNRIGAGNLASMNAGSSSGAPNIEVVVNNEGSPKDASASVKPQVDVNKMVVEIVTRDIRNNGPIRKSLRTGAE